MHFVNDHLTSTQLLSLMEKETNRTAILTDTLCYQDQNGPHIFTEAVSGSVRATPEGKGVPCQEIVSFTEDGHSIAWHLNQGNDPRKKGQREIWKELAVWLQNNR